MLRRSPAEYYIKYLLLHPSSYSDEDVVAALKDNQLDFPGGDYLTRLRAKLKPPRIFRPLDKQHKASFSFLVMEKVHTLFFPDDRTQKALSILMDPKAKEMVESMSMVNEERALMCARMQKANLGRYTPQDITRYQHYFWNTRLLDPSDLRALISKRVEDMQLEDETPENSIRYKVAKRAQYADPRYIAANSVSPLVAMLRLQVRYGYMPDRVSTSRLAELAMTMGLAAAADAAVERGPRSGMEFLQFATGAAKMKELQDMLGGMNAQVIKDLQALAIQTSGEELPSIQELTSGDYSEGLPALTSKEVENE